MAAPNSSFPVTGLIYDIVNPSNKAGANVNVRVRNMSKKEESNVILTNSASEFTFDLGTLPTQWEVNDFIIVHARTSNKSAVARLKIGAAQGSWDVDLYLRYQDNPEADCVLKSVVCSTQATAATYSFVEKDTDIPKLIINVAANSTVSPNIDGIVFHGGCFIVRAALGTNALNMSTGQSNNIGDVDNANRTYIVIPEFVYGSYPYK